MKYLKNPRSERFATIEVVRAALRTRAFAPGAAMARPQ